MKIHQIGNIDYGMSRKNPTCGRVYGDDGIAPCINNLTGGGNRIPLIMKIKANTSKGYQEIEEGGVLNINQPNSKTRRGRVIDNGQTTPTLSLQNEAGVLESEKDLRIRKLTPKECFRLQGWTDEYFERAAFVNSDTQLYKQAGNGVTVAVIKAIAEEMEV